MRARFSGLGVRSSEKISGEAQQAESLAKMGKFNGKREKMLPPQRCKWSKRKKHHVHQSTLSRLNIVQRIDVNLGGLRCTNLIAIICSLFIARSPPMRICSDDNVRKITQQLLAAQMMTQRT